MNIKQIMWLWIQQGFNLESVKRLKLCLSKLDLVISYRAWKRIYDQNCTYSRLSLSTMRMYIWFTLCKFYGPTWQSWNFYSCNTINERRVAVIDTYCTTKDQSKTNLQTGCHLQPVLWHLIESKFRYMEVVITPLLFSCHYIKRCMPVVYLYQTSSWKLTVLSKRWHVGRDPASGLQ